MERLAQTNTTRSWRAMRLVICFIAAAVSGIAAGGVYYDTQSAEIKRAHIEISEINEKLKAIPRYVPPSHESFDPAALGLSLPLTDDERLQAFFPEETRSWKKLQKAAATPLATIGFQATGLGALAGIGGWIGAWILIVSVAFVWWFILDRIREFARAIKGQP